MHTEITSFSKYKVSLFVSILLLNEALGEKEKELPAAELLRFLKTGDADNGLSLEF